MRASKGDLRIGRVLHEDGDFLTIEVAKNDSVKFTLQRDADGETVGGDRFYTILFVRPDDGALATWQPWDDDG